MDFYLKQIIQVKNEDFDNEKKKLELAIQHQTKPIKSHELSDEEKMILIMTAMEFASKSIADKLTITDDALRKRKERLLAKLEIKGLLMLKAWLHVKGILRLSQNGQMER